MRIAQLMKVFGLAAALAAPLTLVGCDDEEGTTTPDASTGGDGGNVVQPDANIPDAAPKLDTGTPGTDGSTSTGDASPGN